MKKRDDDLIRNLRSLVKPASAFRAPAGLAGRIMARLEWASGAAAEPRRAGPRLWLPRLAAAAFIFGLGYVSAPTNPTAPEEKPTHVRFSFHAPEASQVHIAGDFTGWHKVAMSRRRDHWTVTLPVHKGLSRYNFVVDDEDWVSDPLEALEVDDGFGSTASVIQISD